MTGQNMSEPIRRTPLYEIQKELGARFVPFAGWEMPVQFAGLRVEHEAVRGSRGIFDVSHMGEILVSGDRAESFLQKLCCNDVSKLYDGKAQYSALLNESGGVIDDIIIYRRAADSFLLCVNASNAEKDFKWISSHLEDGVSVEDQSSEFAQLALQGPEVMGFLSELSPEIAELKRFHFCEIDFLGVPALVARTGYTGEDGVELFLPPEHSSLIFKALVQDYAFEPCGLGARDTLRLEACYPLHGHELAEDISALESGLGWIVKFSKDCDFIGRETLKAQKEAGVPRKLVAFELSDKGIAREGTKIFISGEEAGVVTSGTFTPTLVASVGMALLSSKDGKAGDEVEFEIRGKRVKGKICPIPLFKSS
jgi:aminomethyltransferase